VEEHGQSLSPYASSKGPKTSKNGDRNREDCRELFLLTETVFVSDDCELEWDAVLVVTVVPFPPIPLPVR
jgi:hypothetical protein